MKTWHSILLGIILGVLFVGILLLVAQSPRGKALDLKPLPTTGEIVVDIKGAVKNPGVYWLPISSRIHDVIQAAGGLTDNADQNSINQASLISDGQMVVIPTQGDSPFIKSIPTTSTIDTKITPSTTPVTQYPININTASLDILEKLPGIGTAKAQQIILFRQEYGQFKSKEELQKVPGIGTVIFDRVKDLITISGSQ